MRIAYLLLATCLTHFCVAQASKIDSLKQQLDIVTALDRVQVLNELSWQFKNSNLDSSKYFAYEALKVAKTLSADRTRAMGAAYNSIANYHEAIGQTDSSESNHLLALQMKSEIGDSIGMAATMNNLGILYDLTDRNDKSLEYYLQALRIYEDHSDDPFEIAMVQGNVGIVLKKLKEYGQAIEYYTEALKIYEEQGSEFGITVTNGNMGSIFINLGDYKKSIEYSQKAKEGYESLGYTRYVPYITHNIAIAQDSLGLYDLAQQNYQSSIDQHREFSNGMELASAQNALATLLNKQKSFSEAATFAGEAINNATKSNAHEYVVRSTKTLAEAEIGQGNYRKGTTLLQQYIVGRDSLFEAQKTEQIFKLQTQYETEKKERQIASQQVELAEQEIINQRNSLLLAGSGGLILLLVVLGVQGRSRLKWKNRQLLEEQKRLAREAEINAVISSQEKERNRFARDLHDGFGQLISTLNLSLKSLHSSPKDDRQKIFDSSAKVLDDMYKELKNICFDLMPQTLIKHGLEAGLNEFANRINISDEKHIEVNTFGIDERLTELQEISLYRISQEWANNILKYSDAKHIIIQLTKDDEEITLLIEDDGTGFDKTQLTDGNGNGWKNMNSRVNLLNGELEIETQKGKVGSSLILNVASSHVQIPAKIVEEIPV